MGTMKPTLHPPTGAFIAASWAALMIGSATYVIGLWNSAMTLHEKGFYFILLIFGLFAAVSLQKSVRDRLEGIPVTGIYFGICWLGLGIALVTLLVGLWNAELATSEKGFYGLAFLFGLFGAVAVQKNVRDLAAYAKTNSEVVEPEQTLP